MNAIPSWLWWLTLLAIVVCNVVSTAVNVYSTHLYRRLNRLPRNQNQHVSFRAEGIPPEEMGKLIEKMIKRA